jgi:hypothetical protein
MSFPKASNIFLISPQFFKSSEGEDRNNILVEKIVHIIQVRNKSFGHDTSGHIEDCMCKNCRPVKVHAMFCLLKLSINYIEILKQENYNNIKNMIINIINKFNIISEKYNLFDAEQKQVITLLNNYLN